MRARIRRLFTIHQAPVERDDGATRVLLAMKAFRRALLMVSILIVMIGCLLVWGDRLLIVTEPLPPQVDVVIALQGSVGAERVRIAGIMDLLRRGVAAHGLLSVPQESFWGGSVPPIARAYLQRNYGAGLAARVDFCETSANVDSTVQEAQESISCIRPHQWKSILVVTSDYHTRRARLLWRRVTKSDPYMHVWVQGVADPEFKHPWWRHRLSAKIWVLEFSKLTWAMFRG